MEVMMKWGKVAAAQKLRALALALALGASLAPVTVAGAFAADASDLPTPASAESSLVVVTPIIPEESSVPADPQLVVATEVLTTGKLTALNLTSVARSAYLVQKAKTRNGARSVGKLLAKENYGWTGQQWTCLDKLWIKESQWTYTSHNKRTGAHGIPQAYPATKYEYMGSDWRKNPVTQILWGLRYIDVRYGTPCKALNTFYRTRMY